MLRSIIKTIFLIFIAAAFGLLGGYYGATQVVPLNTASSTPEIIHEESIKYFPETSREEKVIEVVEEVSSSVVNITARREVTYSSFFFNSGEKTQESVYEEVGKGSGFIVSEDGLVLTNKHVLQYTDARYSVTTKNKNIYPLKVLARDPFRDLALAKIETDRKFDPVQLGNSDNLVSGQTVIAIGNALGQFQNTISVGVVSGLQRTVEAGGLALLDLIQTDAAINEGNSGGPLLNLKGEVIGVNVAKAQFAQNIGFAIPINQAKRDVEQVKEKGKIVYPFLGIRYISLTEQIKEEEDLDLNEGALIVAGPTVEEEAVVKNSTADRMGLQEGDIIVKINDQEINSKQNLSEIIRKYEPGQEITIKYYREGQYYSTSGVLGQKTSSES